MYICIYKYNLYFIPTELDLSFLFKFSLQAKCYILGMQLYIQNVYYLWTQKPLSVYTVLGIYFPMI